MFYTCGPVVVSMVVSRMRTIGWFRNYHERDVLRDESVVLLYNHFRRHFSRTFVARSLQVDAIHVYYCHVDSECVVSQVVRHTQLVVSRGGVIVWIVCLACSNLRYDRRPCEVRRVQMHSANKQGGIDGKRELQCTIYYDTDLL